jgi:RNA polymerase sigma factor (sigma-70 family)
MAGSSDDPDAVLVARVARGDGAAFALIYERYLPLVLRWCWRETGNRELAADLTGEVFAAALLAARRYRQSDGSVAVWLVGIARNKLRESRRRQRVEDAARRRLGLGAATLTDEDLERVDDLASLNGEAVERLAGLPPEQREALVQRVIEERSYEEIARELRCSEAVVRQRVSRGLRALRSEMERE